MRTSGVDVAWKSLKPAACSLFPAKYGLWRRGKLQDSTARVFLESGELPGRYITNSRALIMIPVSVWHETNHESLYSHIYCHQWQEAAGWSNRPSMNCGSSPKPLRQMIY